ncbi:hypothetical protein LINPERPRIM_LOCUS14855 [Linum perenne]
MCPWNPVEPENPDKPVDPDWPVLAGLKKKIQLLKHDGNQIPKSKTNKLSRYLATLPSTRPASVSYQQVGRRPSHTSRSAGVCLTLGRRPSQALRPSVVCLTLRPEGIFF